MVICEDRRQSHGPTNQFCDCRSGWQNLCLCSSLFGPLTKFKMILYYRIQPRRLDIGGFRYTFTCLIEWCKSRIFYSILKKCEIFNPFLVIQIYSVLFWHWQKSVHVIDATGDLSLLPRWLAYILTKRLRYPSRPKMKHRAPAPEAR